MWQPIETAPRDGSEILVAANGLISLVIWYDGLGWQLSETGKNAEDADLCFEPTHWMPLPDSSEA